MKRVIIMILTVSICFAALAACAESWDDAAAAYKSVLDQYIAGLSGDETIREALRCPGPVFVNAIVDETQNFVPKLSSKVLPDGRIVSPSMDDMFPFLPREEYEANRFNPQK